MSLSLSSDHKSLLLSLSSRGRQLLVLVLEPQSPLKLSRTPHSANSPLFYVSVSREIQKFSYGHRARGYSEEWLTQAILITDVILTVISKPFFTVTILPCPRALATSQFYPLHCYSFDGLLLLCQITYRLSTLRQLSCITVECRELSGVSRSNYRNKIASWQLVVVRRPSKFCSLFSTSSFL